MFRPDGYVRVVYPDDHRLNLEHDTVWCAHCGKHTHLKPGEAPYATCKQCMGFICEPCYAALPVVGCRPHEQMLLEMERAINRRLVWERNLREM